MLGKLETYPSSNNGKTTNSRKVAIVDDMSSLLVLYSLTLNQRGHEVVSVASSGEEVTMMARDGKLKDADIMLMDYLMGGMNGLQAAAEVLQYNPRIKMIIASGEDEIENQVSISGLTYLMKLFSRFDLFEVLRVNID